MRAQPACFFVLSALLLAAVPAAASQASAPVGTVDVR